MSYVRTQIAHSVADAFLPTKVKAIEAAAAAHTTVAALLLARQRARMAPGEGADILRLAHEAAQNAFTAQERLYQVHALLAPIRDAWHIEPGAFGPDDTVEPERVRPQTGLHVVSNAA